MKLSCDACGEVGPLRVTLPSASASATEAAAAIVACAKCGAEAAVELLPAPRARRSKATTAPPLVAASAAAIATAAAASSSDEDDRREISGLLTVERRCPKCKTLVGARAACPSCGLSSSRMAGYASARDAEIPEAVRAAWSAVVSSPEAWADQARHDAFVQLAASASAFAWAAGQYQEIRHQRPDDAIALRQLERVRRTAEASMLATAVVREVKQSPYRSATAILVMLVVLLIAGAVYARFMREAQDPAHTVTPVAPLRPGAQR